VSAVKLKFFRTAAEFRAWLARNHSSKAELHVGYFNKASNKPSMGWAESVAQALCFGWIDGIRRNVDAESYSIRFTPRKSVSIWSAVNIGRVEELGKQGLMHPAGLAAYARRRENKSGIYSYEQRSVTLDGAYEKLLKKNRAAWKFFYAQPPSYRKVIIWWVVSAKQEATRLKRLARLIDESARGHRLR
jgi:uncharacterized protein YdeI (YjbR/CyaY-like superfamily)